mgnify:CR=1 FL=1
MKYKKNYFSKTECKKIINLHKTYKNFGFNFDWCGFITGVFRLVSNSSNVQN